VEFAEHLGARCRGGGRRGREFSRWGFARPGGTDQQVEIEGACLTPPLMFEVRQGLEIAMVGAGLSGEEKGLAKGFGGFPIRLEFVGQPATVLPGRCIRFAERRRPLGVVGGALLGGAGWLGTTPRCNSNGWWPGLPARLTARLRRSTAFFGWSSSMAWEAISMAMEMAGEGGVSQVPAQGMPTGSRSPAARIMRPIVVAPCLWRLADKVMVISSNQSGWFL